MKAIIFDVDGVMIISNNKKQEIVKDILQKYGLYDIDGAEPILNSGLNRKLILDELYKLKEFDKDLILKEMDELNDEIESNPTGNKNIIDFIKNNYQNYIFATNTALSKAGLARVIDALGIDYAFKDLLAFENGTKAENAQYIMDKYGLDKDEVLFIDDNINHIESVKQTGVKVLHFTDYDMDIQEYIKK